MAPQHAVAPMARNYYCEKWVGGTGGLIEVLRLIQRFFGFPGFSIENDWIGYVE